ncbi:MAG: VOC family protein [Proteobacteria bacterium]|nr:VOC family protein [Pseudomonadota bacterium]
MRIILCAAALAMGAIPAVASAAPPAALKPAHVAGPGVYVTDLEAQRAWYQDKLGLTVQNTLKHGDKPFEYVMGYGDGPDGAILALAQSAQRPSGPNAFSRVILAAPNAKALAEWLKTQGVASREAIPNVAYFITDPEGNPIELYTAPGRN